MYGIGEVDGRRAARQGDEVPLGREAEDLILKHLELGMLEELLRAGSMLENIEQLAQPAVLLALGLRCALLVGPVRGDAELGDLVHFARTDLNLDSLPLGPDHA